MSELKDKLLERLKPDQQPPEAIVSLWQAGSVPDLDFLKLLTQQSADTPAIVAGTDWFKPVLNLDFLAQVDGVPGEDDHSEQLNFFRACSQALMDPCYQTTAPFFVLEVEAPWLPKGITFWDTPGHGDGHHNELISWTFKQCDVIIPYQRGMPVDEKAIVACLKHIAGNSATLNELCKEQPTLLIFEAFSDKNIVDYSKRFQAVDLDSEDQLLRLMSDYCLNERHSHYATKVLLEAQADVIPYYTGLPNISEDMKADLPNQLSRLFMELANKLMVRPDPNPKNAGPEFKLLNQVTSKQRAMLHDPALRQELLNRAIFNKTNLWVHSCGCFIYKTRLAASAATVERRKASSYSNTVRLQFAIGDDARSNTEAAIAMRLRRTLDESLESIEVPSIETSDSQTEAAAAMPSWIKKWLSANLNKAMLIVREEWTAMISESWSSFEKDMVARLTEMAVDEGMVSDLIQSVVAEISTEGFEEQERKSADYNSQQTVKALFAQLDLKAQEIWSALGDSADMVDHFGEAGLFSQHAQIIMESDWKSALEKLEKSIQNLVKQSLSILLPGAHRQPSTSKDTKQQLEELVAKCNDAKKIVDDVIVKPTSRPNPRTLRDPLQASHFAEDPNVKIPDRIKSPKLGNVLQLELAFELSDDKNKFRMEILLPQAQNDGSYLIKLNAHPGIKRILKDYKRSYATKPELTLPPVVLLGHPSIPLKDFTGKGINGVTDEARFDRETRKFEPVKSLRILLIEEASLSHADDFIGSLGSGLLLATIRKGQGAHVSPALQLDLSLVLGQWLAKPEGEGDSRVPGIPHFVRLESNASRFREAGDGIQSIPASPGRVLVGLRTVLEVEQKRQERERLRALIDKWTKEDFEMDEEYPDLDPGAVLQLTKVASRLAPRIKELHNEEEVHKALAILNKGLDSDKIPEDMRLKIRKGLQVRILSASAVAEGAAKHSWLSQRVSALAKKHTDGRRCNYKVKFYQQNCRTYEQTSCVAVNAACAAEVKWINDTTASIRSIWASEGINQAYVIDEYTKELRSAEKKVMHLLKCSGVKVKDGESEQKTVTLSSGLCCLVVDQYCIGNTVKKSKIAKSAKRKAESGKSTETEAKKANTKKPGKRRAAGQEGASKRKQK
eukprot:TRINITY_DN7059_c0_g1_i1.p1 TRINITY_DN7059_c0_g1~~TRINITY_DN7059_c0_g1_i1.p1  ORF type:complete len:1251 (+),score=297.11 TRINITY_DN7059_c0_g1_i1:375-3755(+)